MSHRRGQNKADPRVSCPQNFVRALRMLKPRAQMALGNVDAGWYSEGLSCQWVFFIPNGHYSEKFYPEGSSFWRLLFRRVVIPKFRIMTLQNKFSWNNKKKNILITLQLFPEMLTYFNTWNIKDIRKPNVALSKKWGRSIFFNTKGTNGPWNFWLIFWFIEVHPAECRVQVLL